MKFTQLSQLVSYLNNDKYIEEQLKHIKEDHIQQWASILVYVYKKKEKGTTHTKLTNHLLYKLKLKPSVYLPILKKIVSKSIFVKQGDLYTYYDFSIAPIETLDLSNFKAKLCNTVTQKNAELFPEAARVAPLASYEKTLEYVSGFSKYVKAARLTNNEFTISDIMQLTPWLTRKLVGKELEVLSKNRIVNVTSILVGGRYHAQHSFVNFTKHKNNTNCNNNSNTNNDINLLMKKDLFILQQIFQKSNSDLNTHTAIQSNTPYINNNATNSTEVNSITNSNKKNKNTMFTTFKKDRLETIISILKQNSYCLELSKLLTLVEAHINNTAWKKSLLKIINESNELTNLYILKRFSLNNTLRISKFIALKTPSEKGHSLINVETVKEVKFSTLAMDTLILDNKQNYKMENYEFCFNLSTIFGYNPNKEIAKVSLINTLFKIIKKKSFYIPIEFNDLNDNEELNEFEELPNEYEKVQFKSLNELCTNDNVNSTLQTNSKDNTKCKKKGIKHGLIETDDNLLQRNNSLLFKILTKLLLNFNILELLTLIGVQNVNITKNRQKFTKFFLLF
eukprot:GAHX01002100.1.p2 GENE.GAHX01002100.1~~GAHX01002100.1.p2  ORF type:complete len:565 (-),score=125.79 GAHX01002100.1:3519-5213(-)